MISDELNMASLMTQGIGPDSSGNGTLHFTAIESA
jgi:hypothetical protein